MDPNISNGQRKLFTDLDNAAMDDIGWDVVYPTTLLGGDANRDGFVDAADYTIYADNYTGVGGSGMVWEQGDFNDDGSVDAADYTIYADNYTGAPSAPVPTPEPATMTLLGVGVVGLMFRRRRK